MDFSMMGIFASTILFQITSFFFLFTKFYDAVGFCEWSQKVLPAIEKEKS